MKHQSTILVAGSNGQLGRELQDLSVQHPELHFVFLDRSQLPIEEEHAVRDAFEKYQPGFVVNCAAYTAVDQAESEAGKADMINGTAIGLLAMVAREHDAKFIHISTDYVFNGHSEHPWKEDDPVDPINAYGRSKLLGERLCMEQDPSAVIIRTSWVYSHHGNNFVKTMLRLMSSRDEIRVVNDQVGSPTYAADLAAAIVAIIAAEDWVPGIFHFSNEGHISWFDFATEIKNLSGSSCRVVPIPSAEFPTPAKRPAFSVMDTGKIRQSYPVMIRSWKDALGECMSKLLHQAR
ncbi:MAG TPA: dTDP-4-dehydrorhamnose reductase [Flavisolibacter sp.]